jgi:hypothetical protein
MVFPLLKRWSNAALGLSSSSKSNTAGSLPLDGYDNSKQTDARSGRKKSRFKHPLSIPMDTMGTAWASDEAIVKEDVEHASGGKSSVEGREDGGMLLTKGRGSRSDGNAMVGGTGWGGIAITKTREYVVTEE